MSVRFCTRTSRADKRRRTSSRIPRTPSGRPGSIMRLEPFGGKVWRPREGGPIDLRNKSADQNCREFQLKKRSFRRLFQPILEEGTSGAALATENRNSVSRSPASVKNAHSQQTSASNMRTLSPKVRCLQAPAGVKNVYPQLKSALKTRTLSPKVRPPDPGGRQNRVRSARKCANIAYP